ncbi:MAG: HAMP domain-containing sensor histidine kinase [Vicinamibacterales bacterium]
MSSGPGRAFARAFPLRIAAWYAGLFVVSAAAVAMVTYVLLARALAAQDHDVLDSMLSRYATEYARGGLPALRDVINTDAGEGRHEQLLVRVKVGDAEVVYFTEPRAWSGFDLARLDRPGVEATPWTILASPPDGTSLEVGTAALRGGVIVQVGRTSHARDALLRNFRERSLQVFVLVVLVAIFGGAVLTHFAMAPLRALDATLGSILHTGRFDARVPTRSSSDPLDRLGGLVNDMLGRIQVLVGGMRGALDNVAHDLRTPLTRLRTVAESALLADDPAAQREGLARALEEADRVNATLTALMDISEAETGTMALAREPVDLATIVGEAVDLYVDEAEDKGVELTVDVPAGITLQADRTRLRQVLANLVANAVKYTDAGGRVDVSAAADAVQATIAVRDTGIGIGPADVPHVWDRLYRADASRSTRGLGLGLSLVKAIVEAHGGTVGVVSTPGHGSEFSVVLPLAPSGPPAA